MDFVPINKFSCQQDNRVKALEPCPWSVLVEFFLDEHLLVDDKQDASLFNGVVYKEIHEVDPESADWGLDERTRKSFVKRRKANIKQVDLLILDYDGGLTIEEARARFADYEYAGYTSYNHRVNDGVEKFRLVFPLACPIPAWIEKDENGREVRRGEWYYLRQSLEAFAGNCDPASFNANQIFYVPSVHPDNVDLADHWHNPGKVLDWRELSLAESIERPSQVGVTKDPPRATDVNDFTLQPDDILQTKEGPVRVSDVHRRYQGVVCPAHNDTRGSEFVDRSPRSNKVYLVCKHCGTIWEEPDQFRARVEEPEYKPKNQEELIEDVLGLRPIDYVDAEDRTRVLAELEKIGKAILYDSRPPNSMPRPAFHRSHIVYLPEGAGKSRLAVDLARRDQKIVFACKSWNQAFEKYEDFKEIGLQCEFSVQLFASKDGKIRRRFGVPAVRTDPPDPFHTGRILDEESIQAIIAANPKLNPDFIRLAWQFFGADKLSFERIPTPAFDDDGNFVEDSEDGNYVGRDVSILVTTFAQLRILKLRGQYIPEDWIIWIDDPDISDVIDIDPYDPDRWGELSDDELAEKTCRVNNRRYYHREKAQSLGYAYRFHKCVYTTTEALTLEAIKLMMRRRREQHVVHDRMTLLAGGHITILGTEKVQKRYDAVIPLVTRRLNKKGFPTVLIADGLSAAVNHSNNKGKNTLNETNILVELSVPHPLQVRTLCDACQRRPESR